MAGTGGRRTRVGVPGVPCSASESQRCCHCPVHCLMHCLMHCLVNRQSPVAPGRRSPPATARPALQTPSTKCAPARQTCRGVRRMSDRCASGRRVGRASVDATRAYRGRCVPTPGCTSAREAGRQTAAATVRPTSASQGHNAYESDTASWVWLAHRLTTWARRRCVWLTYQASARRMVAHPQQREHVSDERVLL